MNRRGQLDQIITSVIVFFAIVLLMSLFVYVSINIGALVKKNTYEAGKLQVSNVAPKVLMDLFLSDDVNVAGKTTSVKDILIGISSSSSKSEEMDSVDNLFKEKYSCNGKNEFVAVYLGAEKTNTRNDVSSSPILVSLGYPNKVLSEGTRVYDSGDNVLAPYVSEPGKYVFKRFGSLIVGAKGGLPC